MKYNWNLLETSTYKNQNKEYKNETINKYIRL